MLAGIPLEREIQCKECDREQRLHGDGVKKNTFKFQMTQLDTVTEYLIESL